MGISPDDKRTAYQQIADDLREQIASGQLALGARLPSTRELMDLYNVANNTAQAAVRELRNEGLVESAPARGTFVRTDINPAEVTRPASPDGEGSPVYHEIVKRLDAMGDDITTILGRLGELEKRQDQAAKNRPPTD